MHLREQLARNLTAESEAYGYTLSIWGGGALLIHQYGLPTLPQIFLYIMGALLAFAVLVAIAFRHLFIAHETTHQRELILAFMIHLLATLGSLGGAYLIIQTTITTVLPTKGGFLAVGFQVTLTYNLLILCERVLARGLSRITPTEADR
jgi:hypothetical protein